MVQNKTKLFRNFHTLLSLSILILICGSNIFAEGQTNFNKKFFDNIKPIKMKEPFAVALGAMDKDELFVYRY